MDRIAAWLSGHAAISHALARAGRRPWLLAILLLLALAGATAHAAWRGPQPPSRLTDLPSGEGLLAQAAMAVPARILPPALGTAPVPADAPPLLAFPDLIETMPAGRLPRIGQDGRRPVQAYRRREPPPLEAGPRVAILLVEIGLSGPAAERAAGLPATIAFAVSPYADDGPGWQNWTRWQAREALLALPVAPARTGLDDAGPDALSPGMAGGGEAALTLTGLLARGRAYPAVALPAGAFAAAPAAFAPLARALEGRGLGLIELGGQVLAPVAAQAALPYLAASGPIDADSSAQGVDRALAAIETQALAQGKAIGYGRAIPITIERLAAWANSLPRKGIRLVGPGELLQP